MNFLYIVDYCIKAELTVCVKKKRRTFPHKIFIKTTAICRHFFFGENLDNKLKEEKTTFFVQKVVTNN